MVKVNNKLPFRLTSRGCAGKGNPLYLFICLIDRHSFLYLIQKPQNIVPSISTVHRLHIPKPKLLHNLLLSVYTSVRFNEMSSELINEREIEKETKKLHRQTSFYLPAHMLYANI